MCVPRQRPVSATYQWIAGGNAANFKQSSVIEIFDDEVMVSFIVVSLFIATPVKKACSSIR